MNIVIVFSQNLILDSLVIFAEKIEYDKTGTVIFVTTHLVLENEREFIKRIFGNCIFLTFAECTSDKINEECDKNAYNSTKDKRVSDYYNEIKKLKNEAVANEVEKRFKYYSGYLVSDDLGIDRDVWIKRGYNVWHGNYYYTPKLTLKQKISIVLINSKMLNPIIEIYGRIKSFCNYTDDVFVGKYDNKKLIFIGKMDRIAYRTNIVWNRSEEERRKLRRKKYYKGESCIYISTLHESSKCTIPDKKCFDVRYIQDGYLPGNYSSEYLKFKNNNVQYYTWDVLGQVNFRYFNLPVSTMPFRKEIYMPYPTRRTSIKKILVATSGPGDWTAQKNRSDEDLMAQAFARIAKIYPDIEIVYRCHPTWIHPKHNGTNSVIRIGEYFQYFKLSNIHLSSNIPQNSLSDFILSFPRSSLDEDLVVVDIVFGEHSVSMIDAAFKGIPFASVNLSNRRDLFETMTQLGFPHCRSINDIVNIIKQYNDEQFYNSFNLAVDNYNKMTKEIDYDSWIISCSSDK